MATGQLSKSEVHSIIKEIECSPRAALPTSAINKMAVKGSPIPKQKVPQGKSAAPAQKVKESGFRGEKVHRVSAKNSKGY